MKLNMSKSLRVELKLAIKSQYMVHAWHLDNSNY